MVTLGFSYLSLYHNSLLSSSMTYAQGLFSNSTLEPKPEQKQNHDCCRQCYTPKLSAFKKRL